MGKFKPISNTGGELGGYWLGDQYRKKYDDKTITLKTLKQGIKA